MRSFPNVSSITPARATQAQRSGVPKEHFLSSPTSVQRPAGIPDDVARICNIMSTYPGRWALCGGWAVDSWLGKHSRDHGDIDLAVFVDDQRALYDHLDGWQMLGHDEAWEAVGGVGADNSWWDGTRLLGVPSHIHARPPERAGTVPNNGIATLEDGFLLDIQMNDRAAEAWRLHADPEITLPFDRAIQTSPWGIPTASPEVLLFYKAQDLRRRDKTDFTALLPLLSEEQRTWLREAIAALGHPWLKDLS